MADEEQKQQGPGYVETPDPAGAAEHRAAVAEEYGTFVATRKIHHGKALAYNVGDPVPAANVALWGYADRKMVAKRGTKAADQALEKRAGVPGRA